MDKLMLEYLEEANIKNISRDDDTFSFIDRGKAHIREYLKNKEVDKLKEKLENGIKEENLLKTIKEYKQKYNKEAHLKAFIKIKSVDFVFNKEDATTEDFFNWIESLNFTDEEYSSIDLGLYFYKGIKSFKLAVDGVSKEDIDKFDKYINDKLDELIYSKLRQKQKAKLLKWVYEKSVKDIDTIAGSGMFNSIIKGYCLFALESAGVTDLRIDFDRLFDSITAEEARAKAGEN